VRICLLSEENFLIIIGIKKLLVAGFPNAVKDSCGEAVDSKHLPAPIAEVY
jgi:hypothetical protein